MKARLISFVVSQTPKIRAGKELEAKIIQSAPQYYEESMPKQFNLGQEKKKVGEREITFFVRGYRPDSLLVETSVEVDDVFSDKTFALREQLIDTCHKIAKERGGNFDLSEEYSLAVVYDYQGDPEQFLSRSNDIVAFLKSEKLPLDEKEIEYTIESQIKYAKDDLVIVDWDGAFIFEPQGQIEAIVDLFQLANLQLLRYRNLDRDLDNRLLKTSKLTQMTSRKSLKRRVLAEAFKETIAIRSQSIAEFEASDRDIKLIGDWYSARLYDLISKKFKLNEWQKSIKEKLDSLEDVYSIITENFSVSRHQYLEYVQIILFFVLQVGWLVLIILELFYYTR